jgi:hypothetical protein
LSEVEAYRDGKLQLQCALELRLSRRRIGAPKRLSEVDNQD